MPGLKGQTPAVSEQIYDGKKSLKDIVTSYVNTVEKRAIEEAMAESEGNKSRVARKLKVDYKTLLRKAKAYGIR
jgi:transcriptional regulator with PAS, ATPase and Fis domain